ncbi:DsbA family oxidoreductase [Asticcacaulis sp. EMRT-3]|uniref:DsbA family oxidoreductase n=1 Tax=Asticcacaulis sp. EMRT-3 TaxID=3040349 RepID=UPI0024AECBCE|nr:DsbA family oxidoreductase [Asticcacaulis sp. EMRT-3]MDI7776103.1 DsbA family oxidoreductase [Asticcacaulis sp. EMRT-3]
MRIDIWSDVVCPFCYIGKASLEQALSEAGVKAEIVHRAFRLQPGEVPQPVDDMLARKYGLTGAAAEAQQQRVTDMAAQFGLDFRLADTLIGDTLDAHKLLVLSAEKGVQDRLLSALYRAYFTDHQNIFDRETLLAIGAEAGLTPDDIQAALTSAEIAARVSDDEALARANGVRGVPFFVIDGQYALSGAQPPAAFADVFRRVQPVAEGRVCGPDNCDPE